MRKKIIEFCEEIKVDFSLFLYHKNIAYPYCCKHSADLISSFLQMVYGENFQYICTTGKGFNHAWTSYCDKNDKFIIDFTDFQHTNSVISKKLMNNEFSDKELVEFIKNQEVVFDPEDTYMYACYNILPPKTQNCYGLINNCKMELNKKCFMEYLELKFDDVNNNTNYY